MTFTANCEIDIVDKSTIFIEYKFLSSFYSNLRKSRKLLLIKK